MKRPIKNLGGNSYAINILSANKEYLIVMALVGMMIYPVKCIIWNNELVAV